MVGSRVQELFLLFFVEVASHAKVALGDSDGGIPQDVFVRHVFINPCGVPCGDHGVRPSLGSC